MRVGSLFSGIGGIELGLERAGGFETLWFVECEPHAQAVLRKHWPNAQIYDDVTTLDFGAVPQIDVLTGGFPCQDISKAGKGAGIEGSRSGLWKHYLRAIRVLRPRIVFAENVSILTDRGLNVVLADLAALGYDAEWHCVPAAAVGAYHRRDRIAIIAYPNGSGLLYGQHGEQSASRGEQALSLSLSGGPDGSDNADTYAEGLWQRPALQRDASGVITTQSGICGVADGVPCRVDRIKRLGNAVVPQWAQAIGETIKETEGW